MWRNSRPSGPWSMAWVSRRRLGMKSTSVGCRSAMGTSSIVAFDDRSRPRPAQSAVEIDSIGQQEPFGEDQAPLQIRQVGVGGEHRQVVGEALFVELPCLAEHLLSQLD